MPRNLPLTSAGRDSTWFLAVEKTAERIEASSVPVYLTPTLALIGTQLALGWSEGASVTQSTVEARREERMVWEKVKF